MFVSSSPKNKSHLKKIPGFSLLAGLAREHCCKAPATSNLDKWHRDMAWIDVRDKTEPSTDATFNGAPWHDMNHWILIGFIGILILAHYILYIIGLFIPSILIYSTQYYWLILMVQGMIPTYNWIVFHLRKRPQITRVNWSPPSWLDSSNWKKTKHLRKLTT